MAASSGFHSTQSNTSGDGIVIRSQANPRASLGMIRQEARDQKFDVALQMNTLQGIKPGKLTVVGMRNGELICGLKLKSGDSYKLFQRAIQGNNGKELLGAIRRAAHDFNVENEMATIKQSLAEKYAAKLYFPGTSTGESESLPIVDIDMGEQDFTIRVFDNMLDFHSDESGDKAKVTKTCERSHSALEQALDDVAFANERVATLQELEDFIIGALPETAFEKEGFDDGWGNDSLSDNDENGFDVQLNSDPDFDAFGYDDDEGGGFGFNDIDTSDVDQRVDDYHRKFRTYGPAVRVEWADSVAGGIDMGELKDLAMSEGITLVFCDPNFQVMRETMPWASAEVVRERIENLQAHVQESWRESLFKRAEDAGIEVATEITAGNRPQAGQALLLDRGQDQVPQWVCLHPNGHDLVQWDITDWFNLEKSLQAIQENLDFEAAAYAIASSAGDHVAYCLGTASADAAMSVVRSNACFDQEGDYSLHLTHSLSGNPVVMRVDTIADLDDDIQEAQELLDLRNAVEEKLNASGTAYHIVTGERTLLGLEQAGFPGPSYYYLAVSGKAHTTLSSLNRILDRQAADAAMALHVADAAQQLGIQPVENKPLTAEDFANHSILIQQKTLQSHDGTPVYIVSCYIEGQKTILTEKIQVRDGEIIENQLQPIADRFRELRQLAGQVNAEIINTDVLCSPELTADGARATVQGGGIVVRPAGVTQTNPLMPKLVYELYHQGPADEEALMEIFEIGNGEQIDGLLSTIAAYEKVDAAARVIVDYCFEKEAVKGYYDLGSITSQEFLGDTGEVVLRPAKRSGDRIIIQVGVETRQGEVIRRDCDDFSQLDAVVAATLQEADERSMSMNDDALATTATASDEIDCPNWPEGVLLEDLNQMNTWFLQLGLDQNEHPHYKRPGALWVKQEQVTPAHIRAGLAQSIQNIQLRLEADPNEPALGGITSMSGNAEERSKYFDELQSYALNTLVELRKLIAKNDTDAAVRILVEMGKWAAHPNALHCAPRIMSDSIQNYKGLVGTLGLGGLSDNVKSDVLSVIDSFKERVVMQMLDGNNNENAHEHGFIHRALRKAGIVIPNAPTTDDGMTALGQGKYQSEEEVVADYRSRATASNMVSELVTSISDLFKALQGQELAKAIASYQAFLRDAAIDLKQLPAHIEIKLAELEKQQAEALLEAQKAESAFKRKKALLEADIAKCDENWKAQEANLKAMSDDVRPENALETFESDYLKRRAELADAIADLESAYMKVAKPEDVSQTFVGKRAQLFELKLFDGLFLEDSDQVDSVTYQYVPKLTRKGAQLMLQAVGLYK